MDKTNAQVFAEHNATNTPDGKGGFKTKAPEPGKECQCAQCKAHLKGEPE